MDIADARCNTASNMPTPRVDRSSTQFPLKFYVGHEAGTPKRMELLLKIPEYLIAPERSHVEWQDFAAASLHTLLLQSGTAIPPEVTAEVVRFAG